MKNKIKENYKKIIVVIVMLLFVLSLFFINFYNNKQNEKVKVKSKAVIKQTIEKRKEEVKEEKVNYYYVDIKGAVKNPGVYKIEEGKRIIDAINVAGGLTEKSDTSIINLSKKLSDEMLIIVYTFDEIKEYKNKNMEMEEINKKMSEKIVCPDKSNDSCINNNSKNNEVSSNSKVSINTATLDELMTISGIGESKAKEIIKYREENGNFESINEVTNVSGIGDALFEKIKDSITV